MRRSKGTGPVEWLVGGEVAQQASDLRHLERLRQLEGRQDPWQAASQHRLARAGGPAHQEVMTAAGRDLEGPARLLLSMNLGEVVLRGLGGVLDHRLGWTLCFDDLRSHEMGYHLPQARARDDLEARYQSCLCRLGGRDEHSLVATFAQPARRDQNSVDVTNAAIQGQLTKER